MCDPSNIGVMASREVLVFCLSHCTCAYVGVCAHTYGLKSSPVASLVPRYATPLDPALTYVRYYVSHVLPNIGVMASTDM